MASPQVKVISSRHVIVKLVFVQPNVTSSIRYEMRKSVHLSLYKIFEQEQAKLMKSTFPFKLLAHAEVKVVIRHHTFFSFFKNGGC